MHPVSIPDRGSEINTGVTKVFEYPAAPLEYLTGDELLVDFAPVKEIEHVAGDALHTWPRQPLVESNVIIRY